MKHALKQMQYRFAIIIETPSSAQDGSEEEDFCDETHKEPYHIHLDDQYLLLYIFKHFFSYVKINNVHIFEIHAKIKQ